MHSGDTSDTIARAGPSPVLASFVCITCTRSNWMLKSGKFSTCFFFREPKANCLLISFVKIVWFKDTISESAGPLVHRCTSWLFVSLPPPNAASQYLSSNCYWSAVLQTIVIKLILNVETKTQSSVRLTFNKAVVAGLV